MNILLISPYFRPMVGGVETHLDDLCGFLNKRKHTVFVRTYKALGAKNRGVSDEEDGFINIHRLWWPDFGLIFKLEPYPMLKFIYIFLGLFIDSLIFLIRNSNQVDVIQAHGFIAAAMAVPLGRIYRKRVVVNTHVGFNLSGGVMTTIIKWTLSNADKILVLTEGIKKSLISLGINEQKIDVYHYWVDQKVFNKVKDAKKKLGWENKFVVMFTGRLIEVKGVNRLIELAESFKRITFVIAGSGPLADELEAHAGKYSNIIFLGKVDNKKLPLYYSGADVLLIPSRVIKQEYEEGMPRVMIEALSCSLPVISTKSGGIPDVFSSEIGTLVDDDIQSISNALNKLYTNRDTLNKLAGNCRSFALKHFSEKNAQIVEKSLLPLPR